MATVTTDPPAFLQTLPSPPPRLLYRMSMEKYEAMVTSGVFTKRDRFQLVEGLLVEKMTEHPPHASVSVTTADAIRAMLPKGWHLREEKPLRIPAREPTGTGYRRDPRKIAGLSKTPSRASRRFPSHRGRRFEPRGRPHAHGSSLWRRWSRALLDRQSGRLPGGGLFSAQRDCGTTWLSPLRDLPSRAVNPGADR